MQKVKDLRSSFKNAKVENTPRKPSQDNVEAPLKASTISVQDDKPSSSLEVLAHDDSSAEPPKTSGESEKLESISDEHGDVPKTGIEPAEQMEEQ